MARTLATARAATPPKAQTPNAGNKRRGATSSKQAKRPRPDVHPLQQGHIPSAAPGLHPQAHRGPGEAAAEGEEVCELAALYLALPRAALPRPHGDLSGAVSSTCPSCETANVQTTPPKKPLKRSNPNSLL